MNKFYLVKVEFTTMDEKGKKKKQTVQYLPEATGVTESEAYVTKYLLDQGEDDFQIKSSQESKISEVILLKQ